MDRSLSFKTRLGARDPAIGLDIGSSAIRAAELGGSPGTPRLVRFGQVGLEPGAVVEGEVRDEAAVAAAVKQLWAQAGFSTRRVVVNVSGQRVIVREAEVTAMSAEDFRSALNFEAQDLIPIPIADAVVDFQILGDAPAGTDGRPRMRIQLVAADREALGRTLSAVKQANLEVVGVDVPQAALMRRLENRRPGGAFGVVSVGADLTNVILNAGERGTFSRTLAVGASAVTSGVGIRLGLERAYAETVKRYAGGDERGAQRAATLVRAEVAPIVDQIHESLEYFLNRTDVDELEVLFLAGGGARTAGLAELLAETTGTTVEVVDAFADLDTSALDPELVAAGRTVALGAVGMAAWGWEAVDRRLSLLPAEILAARKRQQLIVAGAAGAAVLVVALGSSWYLRHSQVASVHKQVAEVQAQDAALRNESQAYSSVTGYFAAVDARQQSIRAVAAAVDWPTLIRQISAVMPPTDTLSQVSLSSGPSTSSAGATGVPATAGAIGSTGGAQVTMGVKATGGEQAVATWLRALATVPSLSNVWVGSSASAGGITTFTCTATVTAKAPMVTYPWEMKK